VIRDAVENLSNSEFVNDMTFSNTFSLNTRLSFAAKRADSNVTLTAATMISNASPTIFAPVTNR